MSKARKLGKKPARFDARTLKLAKYFTAALPPAPEAAGYVDKVNRWGMMLNDQIGDCTVAAAGHMIEQWTAYSRTFEFVPSDAAILRAYQAVSGYVPGNPSTDNGAYLLDVLNYWRKTGVAKHKVKAFAQVNPRDHEEIKQAIRLFGNCYIGLGLPVSAQNTRIAENHLPVWEVPKTGTTGDGTAWSWGGHAVPLVGYRETPAGRRGLMAVSWGELFDVTFSFLDAYCDEAYAVVSMDWIKASGMSPSGFDMQQLLADLQAIT